MPKGNVANNPDRVVATNFAHHWSAFKFGLGEYTESKLFGQPTGGVFMWRAARTLVRGNAACNAIPMPMLPSLRDALPPA